MRTLLILLFLSFTFTVSAQEEKKSAPGTKKSISVEKKVAAKKYTIAEKEIQLAESISRLHKLDAQRDVVFKKIIALKVDIASAKRKNTAPDKYKPNK